MRIYSMTATFGKLEHQTLTLEPRLNVIQAPNEWGKSTWCAFLAAMLYGLDTRSHSTKTTLSDKEHYAPWSGAPMTGRIDLNWNGRDITIERKSKGRTPLGAFRAYETRTGLILPELNGQNCGQMLLGIEKTVFTRSAMIRLPDLPVTQDEALRRRLNALVTTGDDSGTGDELERKLRELKNRCRYNRTGLLPQAEAEVAELERKLRELESLEIQSGRLRQRCADLESQISRLENHHTALRFQAAKDNVQRLEKAEQQLRLAQQNLQDLERQCSLLPNRESLAESLNRLQDLQYRWSQLHGVDLPSDTMQKHPLFEGMTPEEIREKTAADIAKYKSLTGWKPFLLFIAIIGILIGSCTAILAPQHLHLGFAGLAAGIMLFIIWFVMLITGRKNASKLAASYGSKDTDNWTSTATDYVNHITEQTMFRNRQQSEISALREQTLALCQNLSPADAMQQWQAGIACWDALAEAEKSLLQQQEYRDAIAALADPAPVPQFPDNLSFSDEQTKQQLVDAAQELRETQHRLGQCQGQMEAIGYRTALEAQRNALLSKIRQLENTYAALTLALETLEKARDTLQRRFAPRITARAKELLFRLTEGRYDRLVLDNDLTLHATAAHEDTQRSTLWRSDGTADLLYLALRLAVAEALSPESPLILDDALIRFDDIRLARAMSLLKEESAHRQIILFTCHSRESKYL